MAQRKLQQEIEKCFKKVQEGVEEFEGIYEKYEQSTNTSQREKLVENLKRECKKLQRLRDQIKTWATSNEVKDKGPLLEKRELIETQMEKFKAVEKEMKTKAFSKEGLQLSAKLDPKEREKLEVGQFLSDMVEELGRQVEAMEAEAETLQVQVKKSKRDTSKTERVAELEHTTERHKWHQGQLELLLRALENDSVEVEEVKDQEESIKYYVENNQDPDFTEDDTIYDDFNLDEEESRFGVHHDLDKVSSQDNQSIQDETPELDIRQVTSTKSKSASVSEASAPGRRPSQHIKSPLPALATLHTAPAASNGVPSSNMKPAPPPAKPVGEPLKYASAAAAAAASDKTGVGIAPLPPPTPSASQTSIANTGLAPMPPLTSIKSSATTSPSAVHSQPLASSQPPEARSLETATGIAEKSEPLNTQKAIGPIQTAAAVPSPATSSTQPSASATTQLSKASTQSERSPKATDFPERSRSSAQWSAGSQREETYLDGYQTNGLDQDIEDDESILHYLPASLHDLVESFIAVKDSSTPVTDPEHQRRLASSFNNKPTSFDAEKPHYYKPKNGQYYSPAHYPQHPLPIFDDPRLYERIDTDTLFYSFYYRQGTYQQYLAAKRLKGQSWRFHKQYQTWFQRHEEPKNITEDFEQGTYRFFDYESTWLVKSANDRRTSQLRSGAS